MSIKCRAAIAFAPRVPLEVVEVDLEPPRSGEVLVKIITTAICHTDHYTWSGLDPEGVFPVILGHEACGIVERLGHNVTSVRVGDRVVPLYVPECRQCKFCLSGKTNLCQAIRETQGRGLLPDGTTRFSYKGTPVYHYMGCSTFSEYTVVPEIALARIERSVPADQLCLLGCGVTTGMGAVMNTAKVEEGTTVAIFGLGTVGLSAVVAARLAKCRQIIAIDINPEKFEYAMDLGATECINPNDYPSRQIKDVVCEKTDGGVDYSFECAGNVKSMRAALECCHKGWGQSVIVGVAGAGQEISTLPFNLVVGRVWKGTAFGGVKGRSELHRFVDMAEQGSLPLSKFVSGKIKLAEINKGFEMLRDGKCLRTVIELVENHT